MSPILLVVFSLLLVAAQAGNKPRIGYGMPRLGLSCIVGGYEATKGEFRHQVSLQWGLPPLVPYTHFCGGTIISSRWILTAGHCVDGIPDYGSFVVKSGKHKLPVTESGTQTGIVEATYVHESFVGNYAPNDIALLKLKFPLTIDLTTDVIALPKISDKPTGSGILAGWGSVSPSNVPDTLQKIELPIITNETCEKAFISIAGYSPLDKNHFCTGPMTDGCSTCNGDSGGPLIKRNSSGQSEVIGVVSWGITPCGVKGAPTVYTNVGSVTSWIKSTMIKYG